MVSLDLFQLDRDVLFVGFMNKSSCLLSAHLALGEGKEYSKEKWKKYKEAAKKAEEQCEKAVKDMAEWVGQGREDWRARLNGGGRRR